MKNANIRKIIVPLSIVLLALLQMSNSKCSKKKESQRTEDAYKRDSAAAARAADSAMIEAMNDNYLKEGFVKATITDNTGLDGCRFLIQLESGQKLEPVNLDSTFHKDGKKVWLKYQEEKDAMSICMAGEIVRIISIEERE